MIIKIESYHRSVLTITEEDNDTLIKMTIKIEKRIKDMQTIFGPIIDWVYSLPGNNRYAIGASSIEELKEREEMFKAIVEECIEKPTQ